MLPRLGLTRWFLFPLVLLLFGVLACGTGGPGEDKPVIKVGGIPDQDASRLSLLFQCFANLLSEVLGFLV